MPLLNLKKNAMRHRGIVPQGCLSLAPDSLLWEGDSSDPPLTIADLDGLDLNYHAEREKAAAVAETNRRIVQKWLMSKGDPETAALWQKACGVIFRAGLDDDFNRKGQHEPCTIMHWSPERGAGEPRRTPNVEVHSVRTTRRAGPDGQDVRQLVIEVTQRRRGFFDPEEQKRQESHQDAPEPPEFTFRGGATLIFDMFTGNLRYTVRKRITGESRLAAQREFMLARAMSKLGMAYSGAGEPSREPFALVHRGGS